MAYKDWRVKLPGMRIIKTALAVFGCLLYYYVYPVGSIVDAPIAAIVCLQQSVQSSFRRSLERVLGTLIAGIYACIFLWLFRIQWALDSRDLLYYLLVALFLIPLMYLIAHIGQKGAVAISGIVFVLVCLGDRASAGPVAYVSYRVLDTIVGITIALLVNWLPFLQGSNEQ